ncbi:hypothetical protein NE237_008982 [Protea cynaroides]|uniref:F-box domain-containing protein n=1 Tax=Protea cynaroides TaxID=273540 RepID=A0A9Q0KWM0_9MAGN|nr:hypothetical protein NE237_008982 [Protea cynaroides]
MKRGKQNQPSREIMWSVLPSEVEENILSRLPVKFLMRFRCVCKHWCNLVTDPHFIKLQLNLSSQIQESYKLARVYCAEVCSIDVEACRNQYIKTSGQKKAILQTELVLPDMDGNIVGSCNGLLCLDNRHLYNLYLLNPATKEYKRLLHPREDDLFSWYMFGFGYNPKTDEYKVVMISYYRSENSVHCRDVYVYTIGTNPSWRSIGPTEYEIECAGHALVYGAVHWIASDTAGFIIVSFDFGDEKFRELSPPEFFRQEGINYHTEFSDLKLVELEGFLSLYWHKYKSNFEIWVMKNYVDEQSWTKVFSVAHPILSQFWESFKPLVILKKDEEILCGSDFEIFILDVVKNEIRILHSDECYDSGTELYFESLVSLRADGGTDLGNKQERRETEGERLALEATGD